MRLAGVRRRCLAPWTALWLVSMLTAAAFAAPRGSASAVSPPPASTHPVVDVLPVTGAVTPIMAQQIERQIARSTASGARALVLVLDTPGGLESSMRQIVRAILASPVPVLAYVAPPGARAASAGLFLVTASHVAAMAPGTNLGAASPVSLGGPMDTTLAKKATSDAAAFIEGLAELRGRNAVWNRRAVREAISANTREAVARHVVDFMALDVGDLLRQADRRTVRMADGPRTLDLAGATTHTIAPSTRYRILSWIADPTIAYLLLTLGFYGLLFELQSPGAILPGVAGAIFLLLGCVALQMLPVNTAGLALLLLGLAFFALEVKVQSHGMLAAGGVVSFALGSLMLFQPEFGRPVRVALPVIVGVTASTVAFFTVVIGTALAARRRRITTGPEGLIGARGEALTDIAPRGDARVHGEIWRAESATPLPAGSPLEVVQLHGLTLLVRAPAGRSPR